MASQVKIVESLACAIGKRLGVIVASYIAVQSHFSYDIWSGTLVEAAPPSLARKDFRTPSESSQISLGPNFSSHMALKVLRKALGNSLFTTDVNLKQFSCSFSNSSIFPSRRARQPRVLAGCLIQATSVRANQSKPVSGKENRVQETLAHSHFGLVV